MKWFKHQSDSNLNAKLQDLVLEYGYEGYGIYWYCLELIAGNVEPENMTFELEHDARLIAKYGGIGVQKAEEIMRHMVKLELFECSDGRITCLKLAKRCDDYTAKLVKQKGLQVIENKGVRESSTNSEKVPLEEKRIEQIRSDKNKEILRDSGESPAKCPASKIIQLYNKTFPELTQVLKETNQRKTALKARWRENPEMQTIEAWEKFFNHIRKSDFLMGRTKDWKADFDWIVKAANFVKIYEGKYHS